MKRLAAAVIILVGLLASGVATQALSAGTASALPGGPVTPPPSFSWFATSDGGVFNTFGSVGQYGSAAGTHLNAPVVGMAATPGGYWLVAKDGGVFSYGDANFYGSAGGTHLNAPVVGMAVTGDGGGYWLVASDGGVFSYGDANFYGSTGGQQLNAPVVGMAATPSGGGYWLVAADGGVFTYGANTFYGSMGGQPLSAPIVSITSTLNGAGYVLVSANGGTFPYGDGDLLGPFPPSLNKPVVAMVALPNPPNPFGGQLTVLITNNSTSITNLVLYQDAKEWGVPNAQSLAWAVFPTHPGTSFTDTWGPEYMFTAGPTGVLKPGVTFAGAWNQFLNPFPGGDSALFQFDADNGYSFATPTSACPDGQMCLQEDGSLPDDNSTSVGFNMGNNGTVFAVQASPNTQLEFAPHPNYWVTAGTYVQGEVLDPNQLTNSAPIEFPTGVTTMTATLNADNTWTVRPGPT